MNQDNYDKLVAACMQVVMNRGYYVTDETSEITYKIIEPILIELRKLGLLEERKKHLGEE